MHPNAPCSLLNPGCGGKRGIFTFLVHGVLSVSPKIALTLFVCNQVNVEIRSELNLWGFPSGPEEI